jgi:transcriptional regulator with XRE-family HTH domain
VGNTSKNDRKSIRDVAYYTQRYRNRVFSKIVSFVAEQCELNEITKKDIAERLGKDPGLISSWLSQPSNLTLDIISEILLALDAEAEPPDIVLFRDRKSRSPTNT